jgi:transcriptional regulator with XRE-family HTH domain
MRESKNQSLVALGLKVKSLRKSKKLSQEALAFDSEIDLSYLSRIERSENNPTYLVLCAIAKALGVHVAEFF